MNAVTQRCVEFFRNANAGQIIWHTQLERELFAVRFDEAKVQQALTKILENAVEALDGTGQITVQTRNLELTEPTQDRNVRLAPGTYVCVEIVDNGSGIEADVLPRIFEPFFTTKGSSHRGLGLALVYGIVTNHGGGVAVSSQPGTGTSVRVYLPAEKQFVRESAGAEENLNGTETVLVVDDEDLLLTMAETILSEYGYHVLTANSGQKALAMLSRDDVARGSGDDGPGDADHGRARIGRAHPAAVAEDAHFVHERLRVAAGPADRHCCSCKSPSPARNCWAKCSQALAANRGC